MSHRCNKYFGNAPIWLVIGMSIILAFIVIVLAVMNYNRERQYMIKFLSEKGASLISAFEAGARTGMMGAFGTLPRLDTLIKETAAHPDILYIAIVDPDGEIIAHNDSSKIGQKFLDPGSMTALDVGEEVKSRTVGGESFAAFEVYKLFLPVLPSPNQSRMMQMMQQRRQMMQSRENVWRQPEWAKGLQENKLLRPNNRPVIFIGMDTTSFEEAKNEDIKLMVTISGVLLLLGIAGVVSLFWAQNYAKSKRLLSNISAISSEMITNLPEGVILTDKDLKVHYMNEIAGTLLGIDAQEAIGNNSADILPATINSMNPLGSHSNRVVESEMVIEQLNGKKIPVSVIATEVMTNDGIFVGQMYLMKDLTQIKQLQSEIQRKDKMAAIGNLAAGVAHEVRNPLSSIKGYASYFKSLFPEDSKNRAAAEILVNETERLNRVITELLEISRPSDIKPKNVDIQTIFDTSLRLIHPDSIENAKTEVSLEVADDITSVFVDPDRFVQVLVNIYLNSIQAMPDGGLLRTKVFSEKDHTAIIITDTGRGMSKETKSQIFNPYFTTKTTGTGLGMAIVQKIIDAHGGEIKVLSEEGKGTEITIYLPKNERPTLS